jgi:Flp pilus assembly protein TadG
MVNFRFHLVSLTAVFLGLAIGILIGAEVIDQRIVEGLQGRINAVEARVKKTDAENDALRQDVRVWQSFAAGLGDEPVAGRLATARIVLFGADGMDRTALNELRQTVANAGATIDGTVWFTGKWRLTSAGDTAALAAIVGAVGEERADRVRSAALDALSASFIGGNAGTLIASLAQGGFVDFEGAPDNPVAIESLPRPGESYVVVNGPKANVTSDLVLAPFARLLALGGMHVLAAEPKRTAKSTDPSLVSELRKSNDVNSRLSTVDGIDDYRGRVAGVLALEQLSRDRTGHYGAGGDTVLPSPNP